MTAWDCGCNIFEVNLTEQTQTAVKDWLSTLGSHIDLHVTDLVHNNDLGVIATIRDRISGESITIGAGT